MKKKRKEKVYFTLESDINEIFEKHIKDDIVDKSRLLETLIIEYLKTKNLLK
jgi:hypothetical protein